MSGFDGAKAELHCHIEGAAPARLVKEQAVRYGIDVTSIISDDHFVWSDFTTFMNAYDLAASLFRTEADYAMLAETYFSGLARDGAIYGEIFVSPDHARSAGLEPQTYVNGLGEGIRRANEQDGIIGRMIVVGVRHLGADAVLQAARFAASRPHPLVTGFGVAGDERSGHVAEFSKAFDLAREAELGLTIHAGELAGADSVRDALDHVRPSRIGHGVRAIEDPRLVERIAQEGVVLEVCPGSNIALGIYPDHRNHPLRTLIDSGVKVTLNSDDPPYFLTSLKQEYDRAADLMGLSHGDLTALTMTAIRAAFVDDATRSRLLEKLLPP